MAVLVWGGGVGRLPAHSLKYYPCYSSGRCVPVSALSSRYFLGTCTMCPRSSLGPFPGSRSPLTRLFPLSPVFGTVNDSLNARLTLADQIPDNFSPFVKGTDTPVFRPCLFLMSCRSEIGDPLARLSLTV